MPQTATYGGHDEYGLSFQLPIGGSVTGGQGKDIKVAFDVTTTFGDARIIDDYLSISGYVLGGGQINVSENVANANEQTISSLLAYMDIVNGVLQQQILDVDLFAPQNYLHIFKDVNWYADNECGTQTSCVDRAFISDFSQLFSQLPPDHDIPEPSSMILFGLGLFGLRVVQRKRAAK
jgi:hypothetical protein